MLKIILTAKLDTRERLWAAIAVIVNREKMLDLQYHLHLHLSLHHHYQHLSHIPRLRLRLPRNPRICQFNHELTLSENMIIVLKMLQCTLCVRIKTWKRW